VERVYIIYVFLEVSTELDHPSWFTHWIESTVGCRDGVKVVDKAKECVFFQPVAQSNAELFGTGTHSLNGTGDTV